MVLTRPNGQIEFRNCLGVARSEIQFARRFVAYHYGQTKRLTANQIAERLNYVREDVAREREMIALGTSSDFLVDAE